MLTSKTVVRGLVALLALTGCSDGRQFQISGTLSALATPRSRGLRSAADPIPKSVTHVMAANPQASAPDRAVSSVSADGAFSLRVRSERPYVLVFIDSARRGLDMIAGIFKAQTLDTLAAARTEGAVELGTVNLDPQTRTATASIAYDELLEQLGLSHSAALTLGQVDDLSLRLANPDIDGDGQIDAMTPGQDFFLDFHVRTEPVRIGGASGPAARVGDIVNRFIDGQGPRAAYVSFNLASIYAVYRKDFDDQPYAVMGSLGNGGAFSAILADGTAASAPSSYSQSPFGDMQQWGPDYDMTKVQMPGSGGSPATLSYGLASGRTLTFANVVTRSKSQLEASGTLVPFLKLRTRDGSQKGAIVAFEYQYMKRVSAMEWAPASDEEVRLIINDDGGYAGFYLGSKRQRAGFRIPRQASGVIEWRASNASGGSDSATPDQINGATPDSICSMAISYDDKLGLRIFAGSVEPNPGIIPCY